VVVVDHQRRPVRSGQLSQLLRSQMGPGAVCSRRQRQARRIAHTNIDILPSCSQHQGVVPKNGAIYT